jgi:hypothetical protein
MEQARPYFNIRHGQAWVTTAAAGAGFRAELDCLEFIVNNYTVNGSTYKRV